MGDMAMYWFDWEKGKVLPDKHEYYSNLMFLFNKVPKVEFISNEILIEFE